MGRYEALGLKGQWPVEESSILLLAAQPFQVYFGPVLRQPCVSHVKAHSVCLHDGLDKPWSPSMGPSCSKQLRIKDVGLKSLGLR